MHWGNVPLYWYSVLIEERPDETGLSPGEGRSHALPLNNPSFVRGTNAAHVRADDLVVGVVIIKGQVRAYPWSVFRNHNVINDTIVVRRDLSPAGSAPTEDGWLLYEREPPNKRHRDRYIPLLITLC